MMAGAKITPKAAMFVGWGLAYLLLVGAIGMELDWGRHIQPPLPTMKPAPAARVDYPVQPEFTLLPLGQGFTETTTRPVFSPDRRPPPPPAPPEPPKPTMQKGQFVLLGALITKEKSIALLRDVATGKPVRVEQGKEIKGITVADVFPERVVLSQYDDIEELVLKIQPMPKPVAVPKAVAGQPAPQASAGAPVPRPVPEAAGATAGSGNPQSLINRRRAARGLPPI